MDPEFQDWVTTTAAHGPAGAADSQPLDSKRDLQIAVIGEDSGARSIRLHRAWVSEFTGRPDLIATGNEVAFETMRTEHQGWEFVSQFTDYPCDQEPQHKGKVLI